MIGKVFVLGSKEAVVGFRLAGIRGEVVEDREMALKLFKRVFSSGDYRLLIVTEGVARFLRSEIEEAKARKLFPLVVEVPDRGGFREKPSDFLERMIKEALGLGFER